ncbi:hypothetical protein ESA94_18180 [Lacibacter luteus]|uniref:Uncharacterized protein n=1 Tax=Lacibacter luteus TaxID=2508719 RepID=A0A4V1M775_9BACT|nr:hypothetical protein [Lacibacter luteus]RXK58560.1 hypothetical protein ESA94_18180 [Lacibacter luteus]
MYVEVNNKEILLDLYKKKPQPVSLRLSELTREQNLFYEKELNNLVFNCGCASGRSLMRLFFPAVVILIVAGIVLGLLDVKIAVCMGISIMILLGLIGKLQSINTSKMEYRKKILQIVLTI